MCFAVVATCDQISHLALHRLRRWQAKVGSRATKEGKGQLRRRYVKVASQFSWGLDRGSCLSIILTDN